jgi:hypothetical protein
VSEIRDRRRRLRDEVEHIVSGNIVLDGVRKRPALWLAGGLLAGVLVGRFGGPQLVRAGRNRILGPLEARAKSALTGALVSGVASRVAALFDSRADTGGNGAPPA